MQDNSASLTPCPRLAGGFRLQSIATQPLLAGAHGAVRINSAAAAVLALCDGTHAVDAIVNEIAGNRHDGTAGDVRSFLDAARRRGWVETG